MTDLIAGLIAALRAPGPASACWRLRDRLSIACFYIAYAIRSCIPVYGNALRARRLAEDCAEQRYGEIGRDLRRIRSPEVTGTAYPRLHLVGQEPAAEPERPLATVIPLPARSRSASASP